MNKNLLLGSALLLATGVFSVQAGPTGQSMYNSLGCAGCHGAGGKSSVPAYPSLNGQHAAYTVKQMKDFQSGARKDATMNAMAPMAAGHEQEIADYLASQ